MISKFLISILLLIPLSALADESDSDQQPADSPKKQTALKEVPPPPPDFADSVKQTYLTPTEIRKLKQMMDETTQAANDPAGIPAKPETGLLPIDLSPGVIPPVIRLSESEGSTLVFLDLSGMPWPIQNTENFSPKIFTVKRPIDGGHIMTLTPKAKFGNGNVAVFLQNLATPIMLTVLAGQDRVDYRVDMRIPKHVPSTQVAGQSSTPGSVGVSNNYPTASSQSGAVFDPLLSDVLSNTVPDGSARRIHSVGGDVMAWVRGTGKARTLLIRTSGTILSPAPLDGKKAISSDGTKAYEIRLSPVITILIGGHSQNVTLDIET